MKHKKRTSAHKRRRSFFDFRGNDLADTNEQELQKEGFSSAEGEIPFDFFEDESPKACTPTEGNDLPITSTEHLPNPSNRHAPLPNEIKNSEKYQTKRTERQDVPPRTVLREDTSEPALFRVILIGSLLLSLIVLSVTLYLGSALLTDKKSASTPTTVPEQNQDHLNDPQKNDQNVGLLKPSDTDDNVLSASELYRRSIAGVVSILTESKTASGIGSGFLISQDGYIATAAHVIENMTKLTVRLWDGRDFAATVIASNELTDLAVLKINAEELPFLTFGKSEQISTGDRVFAIGTPASIDYAGSLSSGEISYANRTVKIFHEDDGSLKKTMTLIQTNAPVNPGNSGCPLFNEYGQVIGIVTMKLGNQYDGIGFALPSDGVIPILQAMIRQEPLDDTLLWKVSAPAARLGILGRAESENGRRGVRILDFDAASSDASTSILQQGDLIIGIDTQTINDTTELRQALEQKKPGQSVRITVLRFGQELTFDFTLEK